MQNPQTQTLETRLKALRMHGCLQSMEEFKKEPAFESNLLRIVSLEEVERHRRQLNARISAAKLPRFEPISSFDWSWPKDIDRTFIEELFTFRFLKEKTNLVFLGSAGLGKTMITQNLVHESVRRGHTAVFIEAVQLLSELLNETSRSGLDRLLKKYARPELLAIDEVGYLSYDSRHADLLMRVIHMRHCKASTIITTNRPFSEWRDMFPNAASVTALLDRLTENCEVIQIEGPSYRGKKAQERTNSRLSPKKGAGKT
jgi:DNA replication protein DnaC